MDIHKKKQKPKVSEVYSTYWRFATKRQDIFFNKFHNINSPCTDDLVLKKNKFTNAYRASDRVSQYLIRNVIYQGEQNFEEIFFRTILFKTFNKIDTWVLLNNEVGNTTIKNYNFKKFSAVLSEAMDAGKVLYSGAYIMASGKSTFGHERKFQNHLRLIEMMLKDKLPEKILRSKTLESVFDLLKTYPTVGNFLAYQYAIDLNYSGFLNFSEMDFVMPGPGARDGIKKCFADYGDYTESDIIQYVTDMQETEFKRLDLNFKNLWGRRLQLIDCQNLFCEVGKYARVMHPKIGGFSDRKRIKQLYNPNNEKFEYWYPPKWNINHLISKEI